jgi:hypothetical protein
MLRHVSALAVGHLQEQRKFFSMCSFWFNLYCRNFACMVKIIVFMKIKYHNGEEYLGFVKGSEYIVLMRKEPV